MKTRDELGPVYLFCLALVFFLPIFGLLAAALLLLTIKKFGATLKIGLYHEYQKYLSEKRYSGPVVGGFSNMLLRLREEVGFEPFIDIMQGQELRVKMRVIEKLSRDLRKENVRILKEAFSDPSLDIRIFAAAALAKMDSNITREIELAIRKTKSRGQAIDFSQLGDLYLKYVNSGLIEKGSADYYLSLATDAYHSSLDIDTNQPEAAVNYVSCLFQLGQQEKAKIVLDQAVKVWPDNAEIVFLRNEVYFDLKDFKEVVRGLSSVRPENLDAQERGVWEFWTGKNQTK